MSYKDNKLPLEAVIDLLPADKKVVFNEFIDSVKNKKLTPHWYATNAFKIAYLNRAVFRFTINKDGSISLFFTVADKCGLDDVLQSLQEDLQKFYFSNIRRCIHCNPAHGNGRIIRILDNEYGVCAEPEMRINNPTKEQLDYILKFIEVRKANIQKNKQKGEAV